MPSSLLSYFTLFVAFSASTLSAAQPTAPPDPVSPGGSVESSHIESPCPTFSWGAKSVEGALELVVFQVDPTHEEPRVVIQKELSATARTWTPDLSRCLAWGEEYGWFLRRLEKEPGPWSEPRYFRLPDAPTEAQAARAATVLRRYLAAREDSADNTQLGANPSAVIGNVSDQESEFLEAGSHGIADRETGVPDTVKLTGSIKAVTRIADAKASHSAALRGMKADPSGAAFGLWGETASSDGDGVVGIASSGSGDASGVAGQSAAASGAGVLGTALSSSGPSYGVRGVSSSPDGAGVLAENMAGIGTPDLVLGGNVPATLTEAALSYDFPGDTTFNFRNDGDGSMSLEIDDKTVVAQETFCDPNQAIHRFDDEGNPVCIGLPVLYSTAIVNHSLDNVVGVTTSIAEIGGTPVISYYDATATALRVASCGSCTGDDETGTVIDGVSGDAGLFSSITPASDGLPIISYYDAANGALKVAKCEGTLDFDCTGNDETITTVDSGGGNDVGQYTSIAIGADDLPIISYYDATLGALKVAHCNDAACSGTNEALTVVDSGNGNDVGHFTSIAIGNDDLPVISYWDATAGSLKVAHCNDFACTQGDETITIVDDGGGDTVGAHSSIAIGADDLPIISYYNSTTANLEIAHCNDLACTGGDESLSSLTNTSGGLYNSIAINGGLPVISYYGVQSLDIAHCNDVACTGSPEIVSTIDDGGGNNVGLYTAITIIDGAPVISYHDFDAQVLKVADCETASCN